MTQAGTTKKSWGSFGRWGISVFLGIVPFILMSIHYLFGGRPTFPLSLISHGELLVLCFGICGDGIVEAYSFLNHMPKRKAAIIFGCAIVGVACASAFEDVYFRTDTIDVRVAEFSGIMFAASLIATGSAKYLTRT
jgi:hypothetical protein